MYKYESQGFSNTDLSSFSSQFLSNLYFSMLRIRRIEEKIEKHYPEDQMKTPIHLVIGQEAASVGACAALREKDHIYASHRTHGNYLAKGGDFKAMLSEMFCRANGCVGSRGGSMHLIDKKVGMMGTSAIVGGVLPIATGDALAAQMKCADQITGVFFGDAAVEEGVVWESFNFAALKKLPIIYFCENNFYSVCSPLSHRQPENFPIFKKAQSFGLFSEKIDATNVIHVYEATLRAIKRIKEDKGPSFIECIAYRWRAHGGAGDDSHLGYRSSEEIKSWQAFCPIKLFEEKLLQSKKISSLEILDMEKTISKEIIQAFQHAQKSPDPVYEDLHKFVYCE